MSYGILDPDARLSDAEKERLIDGLEATFLASPPIEGGGEGGHGEESRGPGEG
jgi:hypothetical protein